MEQNDEEKKIYTIFTISVILKSIQGFLELVIGLLIYFVSTNALLAFVARLFQEDIIEGPHGFVARLLMKGAESLSVSGKYFIAFYLIGHGVVKLFLILGLIKEKLWSYIVFVAVLIVFIIYEFYRYTFTHSLSLLILTIFDVLFLVLVWHEYNILKKIKKRKNKR